MKRYDHSLGFRRLLMTHDPHLQAMQDDMDALYLRTNPRIVIPKAWSDSAKESLMDFLRAGPGSLIPVVQARYFGLDPASGEDYTVTATPEGNFVTLPRQVEEDRKNFYARKMVDMVLTGSVTFIPPPINPKTGRPVFKLPRKSRV